MTKGRENTVLPEPKSEQDKRLLKHILQTFSASLNTGGIWAGLSDHCPTMGLIQPSKMGTRRVQVAKQRNIPQLAWSRFLVGRLLSDPPTHPSGLVKGLRVSGWASAGAPPPFLPPCLFPRGPKQVFNLLLFPFQVCLFCPILRTLGTLFH